MHWVCVIFVVCLPVVKGGIIFSVKEAASKRKKQANNIWRFLAFVDVDFFVALGDEVEERLEEPRTVCVRPLWCVCTW